MEALNQKYPDGYQNHVFKVNVSSDNFFYAVTLDMEDVHYLIKVPVQIDTNPEEEIIGEDKEVAPDDFTPGIDDAVEDAEDIPGDPDEVE